MSPSAFNGEECGWGEIGVELHLCCTHMDQWQLGQPMIDLAIVGRVRA